jgi:hypothetical protein
MMWIFPTPSMIDKNASVLSDLYQDPVPLVCDNEAEFELDEWCEEHPIRLLPTASHTPKHN